MEQSNKLNSVSILGGGTAGWLAAYLLRENFGPDLKINVIESPKKPIIGVGEATVPTIRFTMPQLGFTEDEWMPHVQGSYKLAVRFNGWNGPGHSYYHPFHLHKNFSGADHFLYKLPDLPAGFDLLQLFSSVPVEKRKEDFARFSSPIPAICDLNKSPKNYDGKTLVENYAYHFDTVLLNAFLRERAGARNIEYIADTYTDATLDERGFIKSIRLESGLVVASDLYIDCSGQESVLIGKLLNEPFIDQDKYLLQNAALAIQIPYVDTAKEMRPYTCVDAMSAGWTWHIPLQHRIGTGYVFSADHQTPDDAWAEFSKVYPERFKDKSPRLIRFKNGRFRNTWVKNCVAMGLAGAFAEPLESTSIGLTEYQIHSLIHLFPDKNFDDHLIKRFNEKINFTYDRLRDYIVLHYYLSQRRDTSFWRACAAETALPDSLKDFLENLKSFLAFPKPERDWTFFQRFNFGCILSGMGALPHAPLPVLNHLREFNFDESYAVTRAREKELIAQLPRLDEYLARLGRI